MGKSHIHTQILQENALFSGKIYTVGNIFTRPLVMTVATNFKSAYTQTYFDVIFFKLYFSLIYIFWSSLSDVGYLLELGA